MYTVKSLTRMYRNNLVHTGMYRDNLVHTGTYWYVREKRKMVNVHDVEIRTKDLMHTNLRAIPLRHQRELICDWNGQYKVYIH